MHMELTHLRKHLIDLKLLSERADESYQVAQYHPPFTLGPLRRNEIWFTLDENNPEVQALVEKGMVTSG